MCCNVGVGHGGIILHASVSAELPTPLFDGAIHFGVHPRADFFVLGFARGTDHEKRVHERIVDRTLQSVALAEL